MVLLVAMIGAIVLTLNHRPGVKRQNIADQVGAHARRPACASSRSRPARGSSE